MKAALQKLKSDGLLKEEKGIGFDQIVKRLNRAQIDLKNARLIYPEDEIGAFRMAYDAMLQAGISLVLFHGYRPQIKNFHKTVVEAVGFILGKDFAVLTKKFDQMRRNRNDAIYDILPLSQTEAEESIKAAEDLLKEAARHIKKKSPQKALF
jgi:uncharacterized protein (UPF0332 family)